MAIGITGANNGYSRSTADARFTKLSAGILDGGNTKGANLIIGTNDAYAVSLETNGTTRMSISANGLVSIDSIPVSRGIGSNNTTNIAIGGGLTYNTTGFGNTSTGKDALSANTGGNLNTAFGRYSLLRNNTGTNNVAVGGAALAFNTTGSTNTAVGNVALGANTTGGYNTAVGEGSLTGITGSSNANTAIGWVTLGSLASGSNNIGIGEQAGYSTNEYDNENNEYILNTSCSNSIFIGSNVTPGFNGDTNEIVIGYGAVGSGSNTTTINNGEATLTTIKGGFGHVLMVEGDVELPDTCGIILVSPDLTRWKITVNDDGSLQTTAL